jgi:hypothetical protein
MKTCQHDYRQEAPSGILRCRKCGQLAWMWWEKLPDGEDVRRIRWVGEERYVYG